MSFNCFLPKLQETDFMTISKAWSWEISEDPIWDTPSEDVYYYVERWKEKGFQNILDLGCGMGRNTILFARNGFRTSGLDLSEYGVNKTRKKLDASGHAGSVVCGDINNGASGYRVEKG